MKKNTIDFGISLRKRRVWYAESEGETPPETPPESTPGSTQGASAGTENTDSTVSLTVPKDRFNEVNNKAKAETERADNLQAELDKYRTAQDQADEDRLKKQGEFEELFNAEKTKVTDLQTQLTTASDSLKAYKDVFSTMLEKRMEKVPDHIKPLLEKMDALEIMTYLDANEEQFTALDGTPRKQTAPPMHGSDGVGNKPGEQVGTLRVRARL